MNNPNNFIVNSDFPTIKNSLSGETATATLTIPPQIWIYDDTGQPYWTTSTTVNIGSVGSILRATIKSSRNNKPCIAHNLVEVGRGSSIYGITPYYIFIDIYRNSPTTATISIFIPNNIFPPTTLVTENITETITVKIKSFKSPFNQ